MPKCADCGKDFRSRQDLLVVRAYNGRWVFRCLFCSIERTVVNTEHAHGQFTNLFLNIREWLASIKNRQKEFFFKNFTRRHERQVVSFHIAYKLVRDDRQYYGLVQNCSINGIRFISSRALEHGQIICINPVEKDFSLYELLRSAAEVRHVKPLPGGTFDIGCRYVERIQAHGENRRNYFRYNVDIDTYYRIEQTDYIGKGKTIDISRGGLRMRMYDPVELEQNVTISLFGMRPDKSYFELYGVLKTLRVIPRQDSSWDVGGFFVRISTSPNGELQQDQLDSEILDDARNTK